MYYCQRIATYACFFSYFLFASVSLAQIQTSDCNNYKGHEIGIELVDQSLDGKIGLAVYNSDLEHVVSRDALSDPDYNSPWILSSNSGHCDWLGELENGGLPVNTVGWEAQDTGGVGGGGDLLIIELYHYDSENPGDGPVIARYAFLSMSRRNGAFENDFYTPLSGGSPDLGIGVYTVNGEVVVRAFKNLPSISGSGSYEELLSLTRYVLPYDLGLVSSARRHFLSPLDPTGQLPNLKANPVYRFSGHNDISIGSSYSLEWDVPDLTLELPQGQRLIVEGDLTLDGTTLTAADPSDPMLRWGGVQVAGTFAAENGTTIEHATAGVTTYLGSTATISGSTLRDNGAGLDVLADGGTTVSGTMITGNGTGVRSGVPQPLGGTVACRGTCRSSFTLFDSDVVDNGGNGVYALYANADIQETTMSGNGLSGLRVSNATVNPFDHNVLEANGMGQSEDGLWVLAGGNVQMLSDDPQELYGVNRLAGNDGYELWVFSGGTAFVGNSTSNGRNSIYDDTFGIGGGTLLRNTSGAFVYAINTFWDSVDDPPSYAYSGLVKWNPVSNCDYTVSPPACIGATGSRASTGGAAASARGAAPGGGMDAGRGGHGALGDEIRAVRAALAANPAAEGAPGLARTLATLHRRDADDETGERAASWGLLRSLRARINNGNGLPAALRPTAEAALEAEAVEELVRGEQQAARALVALAPLVADDAVARVLGLVEAHLEAVEGRYAEAAALIEGVAAEAEVGGEPRVAAVLYDLAAIHAERAGAAGEGRGAGAFAEAGEAAAKGIGSRPSGEGLSVYPNPARSDASVMLMLVEDTDARVEVYDVLGRRVAVLLDETVEAGRHRVRFDGAGLPAGVYLVRAEAGNRRWTERITLVR